MPLEKGVLSYVFLGFRN